MIEELKPLVKDADCGVVICVPYTNLETALEATRGSSMQSQVRKTATGQNPALLPVRFRQTCWRKWE